MSQGRMKTGGAGRKADILLFSRKTPYSRALRENRDARLKRLILGHHRAAARRRRAAAEHTRPNDANSGLLDRYGFSYRLVYDLANHKPEHYGLVMTVGGDGTVLFASHHIKSTPLLGVNSSPSTSAGYLTSATRANLESKLRLLRGGRINRMKLHRLAVCVDGGLVYDRVLNDVLFTSACPAVTARYFLTVGRTREDQMSSGIWIGPAAGSTAALLSAGGRVLPPRSRRVQFVVREPVERQDRRCRLKRGIVAPGVRIAILNKWQRSEIFIDGPHRRRLIQPGQEVTVHASQYPLTILGWKVSRGTGADQ
jgi:NAD+ kinase